MAKKKKQAFDLSTIFTGIKNAKYASQISLGILIAICTICIVVSHVVFDVPIVVVCGMTILEALLIACLNKIPLWIHGLVFIAQIVAGIIAGRTAFMVLMSLIYIVGIIYIFIWSKNE